MLSRPEQRVLKTFGSYLVNPGQMLCFCGPDLAKNKAALQKLTQKKFLIAERFKGAYSLTAAGFDAMKGCE